MTVATFLVLVQILNGLGGAGVAILTIEKDLRQRGFVPTDLLPPEHERTVRAILAPAQSDTVWDETHAPEGG